MRIISLLCLGCLTACASSNTLSTGRTETMRAAGGASMNSGSTGVSLSPSSSEYTAMVASSINNVWRVMPGVYQSLQISLTRLDQGSHTIGNEGFKALKSLGGIPLSKYIECGTTQIGPNADSYDVHLSIVTQLTSNENGTTKITTNLEAAARPMAYAQEYSRCSTKGVLEAKLVDAVNAALAKK
jgi:hypothetical protein